MNDKKVILTTIRLNDGTESKVWNSIEQYRDMIQYDIDRGHPTGKQRMKELNKMLEDEQEME